MYTNTKLLSWKFKIKLEHFLRCKILKGGERKLNNQINIFNHKKVVQNCLKTYSYVYIV